MRYEEVVYKDEHGNIIPEEQLSSMLAEGGNIEFKTIYETKTKTLLAGEAPPKGAKRIDLDRPGDKANDIPILPEGQNPETGEKKAYRT